MFRIAYGGANWVVVPLGLAILMGGLGLTPELGMPWLVPLSAVPFFFSISMVLFLRDPERRAAEGIACPADGKVVRLDTVDDPDLGPCDRLAVFMSPLVVHVNRFPVEGDVRSVTHRPGKHLPAFSKESDRNEQVTTLLRTPDGTDVKVVQIAGAVARRIVPYATKGDHVKGGERLGLIRLGSRCDLLIPRGRGRWTVEMGQRVWAGSTQAGEWT